MLDFTKPIKTRSGKDVEILTTNCRGKYCVYGNVEGRGNTSAWAIDGLYLCESQPDELDLLNVPDTIVKYINVYDAEEWMLHPSRAAADTAAASFRVACIRVEVVKGRYDD
jgi:hypothetical protein